MPKRLDLTDKNFGRLTISGPAPKGHGQATTKWFYRCECGKTGAALTKSLMRGDTKSCGCLLKERTTKHGHARGQRRPSPTYQTWGAMVARCNDSTNPDYGGRGISVCPRWKDFKNFLEDLGEKPSGMTIERIDSAADYNAGNCRWATQKEQNWNKGDTVIVKFGDSLVPLKEAARLSEVPYQRLHFWFRSKGLPIDMAIERARISNRWAK